MSETPEQSVLRGGIEAIADQLCITVDGHFDFVVSVEDDDESLLKLGMLVNFLLDRVRHAIGEMQTANADLDRRVRERTAELELARDQAEAATRAKSRFLATMSHEVRTPLTGVLGMVDLLRATPLTEEQRGLVDTLHQSADGLMVVLDDILDLSKIEAGELTLEQTEFRLSNLIQAVAGLFRGKASERGLSLNVVIAPDVPDVVQGDPTRLRQIIYNLVGNAIKFTERGRIEIRISAARRKEDIVHVRFEVVDTGIGLSPEQQSRLFKAFAQADESTTRKFGGTGLGLVISRRIVEALGGDIGVSSALGVGSNFWFEAPLVAEALKMEALPRETSAPAESQNDALPPKAGRALRILLAEDHPVNRRLIQTVLERMGHSVAVVENGRDAIEMIAADAFELLILDMHMPIMDGEEAARTIRASEDPAMRLPILALTADALQSHREAYFGAGVDRIETKPVNWRRLAGTIEELTQAAPADLFLDSPVLDHEMLAKLEEALGGDTVHRLLNIFIDTAQTACLNMQTAIKARDTTVVRSAAHDLSGAAGNLGAMRLGRIARAMDHASTLWVRLEGLHGQLEKACALTAQDIRRRTAARAETENKAGRRSGAAAP